MRRGRTALALLAALGALYPLLRRPILTWGATSEEAASHLPGDELLKDADGVSTRAITIDAPAASVWPWRAQIGPSPRGGAYTYDWIENCSASKCTASTMSFRTSASQGRRHDRLRLEPDATRAG